MSSFCISDLSLSSASLQKWWVIHTRPRCEKKMNQWLMNRGKKNYLPTRKSIKEYESKKVVFECPLFPGYSFGQFSLLERNQVYGSNFAANILEIIDQESFLKQIGILRQALQLGAEVTPCPFLEEGNWVRVTTGKFKGLEGRIKRIGRGQKLVLSVDMIQSSVCFEVAPEMVTLAV